MKSWLIFLHCDISVSYFDLSVTYFDINAHASLYSYSHQWKSENIDWIVRLTWFIKSGNWDPFSIIFTYAGSLDLAKAVKLHDFNNEKFYANLVWIFYRVGKMIYKPKPFFTYGICFNRVFIIYLFSSLKAVFNSVTSNVPA